MGIQDDWPAWQWDEAVEYWGMEVDLRLKQTHLEPYTPQQQPMREALTYNFWEAFGLDEEGNPLDPEDAQAARLETIPGVTVHKHTLPPPEEPEDV